MNNKECSTPLEVIAGLVTWGVITGVMIYYIVRSPQQYAGTLELAGIGALAFLIAMQCSVNQSWSFERRRLANAVQLFAALGLGWLLPIDFLQIYTIIWIAMAASFYSARTCLLLLAGVVLCWFLLWEFHWYRDNALFACALYATFHGFALMSSFAAIRAEQARDETQMLYRELVATQHLLSEASRQNERTRIARNLHDLIGHHLTALSINLQIAERTTEGEARDSIVQSRALAKLLLSDVRDAVSTLRDQSELDFRRALNLVVENVPQLNIELDVADDLQIDNVEIADALLRCVQEAITNTLRHANATKSWVRLWQEGDSLMFTIRDDGRVQSTIKEGNGLTGIRERIRGVGGTINFALGHEGFGLSGSVPLANV